LAGSTVEERLARLETLMEVLVENQKEVNTKLDELFGIKDTGRGVVKVLSILIGSGILGYLSMVAGWFKGHGH
jgi:hypothetical protein